LQGMTQEALDNLAVLARSALVFLENNDFNGLSKFMLDNKVPPVIVQVMRTYASNNSKKQ